MSLPSQNQPQPSHSPSKPSLRRVSGTSGNDKSRTTSSPSPGPTTHFAAEATQHHFLPHSPPNQNLDYEEEDDVLTYEDDGSYPTASQPTIPLQPFFTLIEDTTTNEHFHPTVHYIFADDEPDIITEAACRSLDQSSPPNPSTAQTSQIHHDDDPSSPVETRLPSLRHGIKEHYIILDVQSTPIAPNTSHHHHQQSSSRLPSPSPGSMDTVPATKTYPYTVVSAQSLSTDWQVFRTTITDAPTMNSNTETHTGPDDQCQHLMLRIEGRGNSPDRVTYRREDETMEDMIERFNTRLAEIRHLMVDLDVHEREEEGHAGEEIGVEGDLFSGAHTAAVGVDDSGERYPTTGFGNAVLDEQD